MKELVAKEIASRVRDGEVIGVGTGTTVDLAIGYIGERVTKEKLSIAVVPTSYQSAWKCQELGFKVFYPGFRGEIAWGFDGADEVNEKLWLIKGKGGAMLKEKILAAKCKKFIVIVDESKVVKELGAVCPIPVEVIPEAVSLAEHGLLALGASQMVLRQGSGKHGPTITEAGNIIIDVKFKTVHDKLEREIKCITGVVESGLFLNYASEVLVSGAEGVKSLPK